MATLTTQVGLTSTELSDRLHVLVHRIAPLPDVKAAVEANHDENRWWPTSLTDPRMRMTVAGWSTRVSYRMVETYAGVVAKADALGFDALVDAADSELARLVVSLGLVKSRIGYFRSLVGFLDAEDDVLRCPADELISRFAANVHHASFNVAQCAVLYSRGYHCGIIPVDSGMVTKLAPVLGISLPSGPIAHEQMRQYLQTSLVERAEDFRSLVDEHRYAVTIPPCLPPSWWLHLTLIYFKRLYLNQPDRRLCSRRPVCEQVLDCPHARS